jgi:hypothetical protein
MLWVDAIPFFEQSAKRHRSISTATFLCPFSWAFLGGCSFPLSEGELDQDHVAFAVPTFQVSIEGPTREG